VAPYLRIDALRDVPAVVDFVDVDSQKWLDYAAADRGARAWLYRLEGARLRRLERAIAGWARAITLVSEAEAVLFRSACDAGPAHVVGVGVETTSLRDTVLAHARDGYTCVFTGALDYRPNVDGVRWFCTEAWPEIRRRHPAARIQLVGRRPARSVCRLGRIEGVEVIGPVPDVRPYLEEAAMAIAPIRIARGIQCKVLEAMAMARAVVASPGALTGLNVTPGVHALSASTSSEWIDAVSRLIGDSALRGRIAKAGRAYVEERHRWEDCLESLGTLLGIGDEPAPAVDRARRDTASRAS
jgi:sugar transferase (PEP-CTERM/EpsH1 system associated)